MAKLTLVTGDSGAGKTRWCRRLALRQEQAGIAVAGLLAPAAYRRGQKVGIDLIDLRTKVRRRLAVRQDPPAAGGMAWRFDPATLAWGNEVLRQATPCEVVVIDELGPLEFERDAGLQQGVRLIDEGLFDEAYVVVRSRLLAQATARWPRAAIVRVDMSQERLAPAQEGSR